MNRTRINRSETSLELRRVFAAEPETLWEIWTNPEKIKQWHRPDAHLYQTPVAETDLKVGGKYKIGMRDKNGSYTAFGEFLEIKPGRKLVYTWQWEATPAEQSQVTVEFRPVSTGTELKLIHEKLSTADSVKRHAGGWEGMMPNIDTLLSHK